METTVFELNARAHNQVFDGAGDKEFARVRERGHSMGDDHCESCDVLVSELDLSGMNAGAHLETEASAGVADGSCARDSPPRSVEGGQRAIAGRLDQLASEAGQLPIDGGVVAVEDLLPAPVTKAAGLLGGAHDR